MDSSQAVRTEVEGRQWYHSFELEPGVVTPGWFDLRQDVGKIPFPDLTGRRCLDVGTFDGFWAFEMEKRGGEVVAIDVNDPMGWDWPAGSKDDVVEAINERKRGGSGFEFMAKRFSSNVERRELSVYDLNREDIGGFDFAYLGSLLLHLRDPVRALTALCGVCDGTAVICDAIDLPNTFLHPGEPVATLDGVGRPWWWRPNQAGLERMVDAAGFTRTAKTKRIRLTPGAGYKKMPINRVSLRYPYAREQIVHSRLGDPHGVVQAKV